MNLTLHLDRIKASRITKPIRMGNHLWIGIRAIILKGVTIGDGVILGPEVVVTCEVRPGCFVASAPAKVIQQNMSWA
ncbi:MAG: transferase [Flavisolibacter sp.]|nr:transferase [Flavisolibacter sp.]